MSKCVLIMGKACSGKDYIMDRVMGEYGDKFHRVLQHTTRPMRDGEENLKDYIFHSSFPSHKFQYEKVDFFDQNNKIVPYKGGEPYEARSIRTSHGTWDYWSDFSEFDTDKPNIIVGDQFMYDTYKNHFRDLHIIYKISSDSDRLQRYLKRTDNTMHFYDEICRRFRKDDFDHEWFFNSRLELGTTPISIIVGDIEPSKFIPDLFLDCPHANVYYRDSENKVQTMHYYGLSSISYDIEYNTLKLWDDSINLYTLEVQLSKKTQEY